MLIRLNVTNFLSFKEETEFNMLTANVRSKKEHVYHQNGVDFLRAAALYGANGAGKSNVVKALGHLQRMVEKGKVLRTATFKLDKNSATEPSIFEIEFIVNEQLFAYYLSVKNEVVFEEELYWLDHKKNDHVLFKRSVKDGATQLEVAEEYQKTDEDQLLIKLYSNKLLKEDELLLSKVVEDELEWGKVLEAYAWFRDHLIIVTPEHRINVANLLSDTLEDQRREYLLEKITSLDIGIKGVELESILAKSLLGDSFVELLKEKFDQNIEDQYVLVDNIPAKVYVKDGELWLEKINSIHHGLEGEAVQFSLTEESDGTRRLLDLLPVIYGAKKQKKVVVVDEIGRSIHPNLLRKIVRSFLDESETNGQLIFTSHEDRLLDLRIFRQDEIWFAEKSKKGATHLYPLSNFKVRKDLSIRNGYLNGRFGGIPFLIEHSLRKAEISTVEVEENNG